MAGTLVDDAADADVAVVNTCGFVEAAKKDSVDALLEANDLKDDAAAPRPSSPSAAWPSGTARSSPRRCPRPTGCSASTTTRTSPPACRPILHRRRPRLAHPARPPQAAADQPRPAAGRRRGARARRPCPRPRGDRAGPARRRRPGVRAAAPLRRRLDGGPVAPLKLASGCDRRCSFCAIPAFRGSFISRRPADVLGETRWLAEQGVSEIMLVSENNTSYGKDLGDIRLLETLLPELAAVDGIDRVRVSATCSPPRCGPALIDVLTSTPGVVPYFDLSFQHSAPPLLRRMRRFGGTEPFLDLLEQVRAPGARGRRPVQLHRRLPRRDRGRPRGAGAVPRRRPGWTPSASSATPTRTAPRPSRYDGKLADGRRRRTGRPADRAGRGTDRPAGRGAGGRDASRCWSSSSRTARPRAARRTRARTSTACVRLPADGLAVGDLVPAVVTGSEGVDLLAERSG